MFTVREAKVQKQWTKVSENDDLNGILGRYSLLDELGCSSECSSSSHEIVPERQRRENCA